LMYVFFPCVLGSLRCSAKKRVSNQLTPALQMWSAARYKRAE
jgi:hypothetical protein